MLLHLSVNSIPFSGEANFRIAKVPLVRGFCCLFLSFYVVQACLGALSSILLSSNIFSLQLGISVPLQIRDWGSLWREK